MRWVDLRPAVDPLTGSVESDSRFSGASGADRAALELGLQLAARWGTGVAVVSAGPEACEPMLRDALSMGVASAVRIDMSTGESSQQIARGLADAFSDLGVDLVLCGDWSLDRGSGSVPAFLAGAMGVSQALGLVSVVPDDNDTYACLAERRLDGGRRERVRIQAPAVISVESGAAVQRRASLTDLLAARKSTIEVRLAPPPVGPPQLVPTRVSPYRPRAQTLPSPDLTLSARERVLALTGALVERTPPQKLVLEAPEAAERIIDQLRIWGYLE